MGLDIRYYSKARLVEASNEYDERDDGTEYVWPNEAFPHATDLVAGYYDLGKCVGAFRAGSYGGYNVFRNCLCRSVLGVSPERVWAVSEKATGPLPLPFWDIINFSDCEGVISGRAALKLSEAFANPDHREAFAAYCPERLHVYDGFAEAFRVAASSGGLVDFC